MIIHVVSLEIRELFSWIQYNQSSADNPYETSQRESKSFVD